MRGREGSKAGSSVEAGGSVVLGGATGVELKEGGARCGCAA